MSNSFSAPDEEQQPLAKLDLKTKLAYGAGDLGTAVSANILAFYWSVFLTDVAGLSAGLAGSIRLISGIWDAANDPFVGSLSDRTRSRWGRRHPWMLAGAIPLGFFFFLHWVVAHFSNDRNTNQWGLFWFNVVVSLFFNTAYTMVNLPYTAMTPELTEDYNERTNLTSIRFQFSIGGSILSLLLALVIFSVVKEPIQQYLLLGGVFGVFSVLPVIWCVWGTRDRMAIVEAKHLNTTSESISFGRQLKIVFSNVPFLYVIGIYLFSWSAVQITASIIPYFVVNWMG
ncbi:MAG: MFS transporter, partial [Nostocaceae cyanobacterium]|nr:MFS transporter [Nostocaceae cyanobacterium]